MLVACAAVEPASRPTDWNHAMTIQQVKQAHELEWMQIPGVEGVGIGVDAIGNPAITLYVSSPATIAHLPKSVEGHPVRVEMLGGPIDAQPRSR
jgi:hypothetical protein